MSYTYPYPHPAVATDCVVFGFDGKGLQVLLIRRGVEPYKGLWAFPGGFMRMDETAEECAKRELQEETSLNIQMLKQLGAFSGVHRDPRERVVSVAFYALVQPSEVVGGDDASHAEWFAIEEVPQLAFDHDFILRKAMQQLRKDIYFEPIGFELYASSMIVTSPCSFICMRCSTGCILLTGIFRSLSAMPMEFATAMAPTTLITLCAPMSFIWNLSDSPAGVATVNSVPNLETEMSFAQ